MISYKKKGTRPNIKKNLSSILTFKLRYVICNFIVSKIFFHWVIFSNNVLSWQSANFQLLFIYLYFNKWSVAGPTVRKITWTQASQRIYQNSTSNISICVTLIYNFILLDTLLYHSFLDFLPLKASTKRIIFI